MITTFVQSTYTITILTIYDVSYLRYRYLLTIKAKLIIQIARIMLKIIARIIPVIIWSLVLGCGRHSDNTDDCPVITINQSDIVEKIDLADVSESNLVFKPETTDASLISRICRVWHYKSCVYILDSSYQLLVFSETGK